MTTQSTEREAVVDAFHHLYYDHPENTWDNTYWLGVPTQKCPLDLWIYQEIIFEVRPNVIVECGTCKGGSALYLASICDLTKGGRVFSIDIEPGRTRPNHKRVRYILGSSTDPDVVGLVRQQTRANDRVLVILDSNHSKEHVLNELRAYAPMVTTGGYIIVEDTNINGHPVYEEFGPGPMEAVDEFLATNSDFEVDRSREKFLMGFNPRGWLRRVR
ncbi:MAG: cephalosporin hydroxylase [Chloroflexi bacterium]|nr:MAG: cephalosporin hydroxylase [Chloroflexota bacterium]